MNKGASVTIIVLTSVVGVAAAGGIGYWVGRTMSDKQASQPEPVVANTNVASNQQVTPPLTVPSGPSVPRNFSSYEDADYGVSLAYPTAWGPAEPEDCDDADQLPGCLLDSRDLLLNETSGSFSSIRITNLDAYDALSLPPREAVMTQRDMLLDVFKTRRVSGDLDALLLPPTNAGTIAHSKAQYVENFDGSWRGYMYYASVGQNDVEFGSNDKTMSSVLAVLTDGSSTIVQVNAYTGTSFLDAAPELASTEKACKEAVVDEAGTTELYNCLIPKDLVQVYEDEVAPLLDSVQSI